MNPTETQNRNSPIDKTPKQNRAQDDITANVLFDEITRLAANICETPISAISIAENDRFLFLARVGLELQSVDRVNAFCTHTIQQEGALQIEDTKLDDRFKENPLVIGEPHVRFYMGYPLRAPTGQILGTLCVVDHVPRKLSNFQTFK